MRTRIHGIRNYVFVRGHFTSLCLTYSTVLPEICWKFVAPGNFAEQTDLISQILSDGFGASYPSSEHGNLI